MLHTDDKLSLKNIVYCEHEWRHGSGGAHTQNSLNELRVSPAIFYELSVCGIMVH
jgi:hypothetical protein